MLVILETSQSDRLPSKRPATRNIDDVSVTFLRSGRSMAEYFMFDANLNASFIDIQDMSPHCTNAVTFLALLASSPSFILLKSPDMDTSYDPFKAYVWVALPDTAAVVLPSPQFTV